MTRDLVGATAPTRLPQIPSELPLCLAYALGFFGATVMPIWTDAMALRYSASVARIGLIASLELGCVAVASVLTATFVKRTHNRAPLATGLLFSILANSASAFSPSLIMLALARTMAGAAHGFVLAEVTRRVALARNPSRVFAGQLFALVAIAMLFFSNASWLANRAGLGAPFLFYAATGILTLVTLIWLDVGGYCEASSVSAGAHYPRALVTFRLGGATLLFCIQTSLWAYLQPAAAAVGMATGQLSRLLAVGAAINLLAPIVAERLGDRLGRRLPFLAGFAVLGASGYLVAGRVGQAAYAVGVIGLSFSTIFLGPFVMASFLRLDATGKIAASAPAFFMTGLAAGPALGAIILRSVGLAGLAVFGVLAAITSFGLFVGNVPARSRTARIRYRT
jgi:predicted MFS family arabinose efflux permease